MRQVGPYELNSIIHGDCLEVMPGIPDKAIGMILADLPYEVTQNEWDSLIPLEPLWSQYKRIIRPGGAIALTAKQPFTSILVMSNRKWFKDEWIWDKRSPTGHLNVKRGPMERHESILIFSDGTPTYNPQYRKEVGSGPFGKCDTGLTDNYGTFGDNKKSGVGYPHSIIAFTRPNNLTNDDAYGLHPNQKPLDLFIYLINTYSNPGDIILDSTAGSCTTAIAAIETGRNWLCIEQKAEYVEIGRERVRERLCQPFLPGLVETPVPQPIQQMEFAETMAQVWDPKEGKWTWVKTEEAQ